MDNPYTTICVTGASGLIGNHICRILSENCYRYRVLSRNSKFAVQNAEVYNGDLCDFNSVRKFLENAKVLFHCAGEIHDNSKMWDVNVNGTKILLQAAAQVSVKYFCYLSSAGVVGKCKQAMIDEDTPCNPQNTYEKSKFAAETLVSKGIPGCSTVILRPTNVIDEDHPGIIQYAIRNSFLDRIKVFVKGGECAHIVHAEDVANAALYFKNVEFKNPKKFFVSCDHERLNTIAGIYSLYKAIQDCRSITEIEPAFHLPIIIPYILRRLWRGVGNFGNIRYSSEKLLTAGYRYRLAVEGSVRRIVESKLGRYKNVKE